MRTLIRTCFVRMPAWAGLGPMAVAIAICAFAALAGTAQNATRGTAAQAELHIQVHVVPAVIPPHRRHHHGRDDDSVTYDFALDPQKFSIIEEIHPFTAQNATSQTPGATLHTTTIVMK